jgi:hypothetical protein
MAAAMGYALRRTSARVVIAVGVGGLFWTVALTQPYLLPGGSGTYPEAPLFGAYRLLGWGFWRSDVAAAVLVAVVAIVAAAALWCGRAIAR